MGVRVVGWMRGWVCCRGEAFWPSRSGPTDRVFTKCLARTGWGDAKMPCPCGVEVMPEGLARMGWSKDSAVALNDDRGRAGIGSPMFGDATASGPGAAFEDFDQGEFLRRLIELMANAIAQ